MNNSHHRLAVILSVFVAYQCHCEDYKLLLCEGQEKYLACSGDATINVVSATYGYNASNEEAREKCDDWKNRHSPFLDTESTNCYHPYAADVVADKCNGLSQCTISVTNEIFSDPCRGVTKYFELYYSCTRDEWESELTTTTHNMSGEERGDGSLDEGRGGRDRESYSSNGNSKSPDDRVLMTAGLSAVAVVAIAAGIPIGVAVIISIIVILACIVTSPIKSCICTKCKKSDGEKFQSNNTRGDHNTGSLDMGYEVVGNNGDTPTADSANQSPHYETSIHVTSANFEYDYAVETRPVRFNEPQATYLNIK